MLHFPRVHAPQAHWCQQCHRHRRTHTQNHTCQAAAPVVTPPARCCSSLSSQASNCLHSLADDSWHCLQWKETGRKKTSHCESCLSSTSLCAAVGRLQDKAVPAHHPNTKQARQEAGTLGKGVAGKPKLPWCLAVTEAAVVYHYHHLGKFTYGPRHTS